jgi:hypothetical protein
MTAHSSGTASIGAPPTKVLGDGLISRTHVVVIVRVRVRVRETSRNTVRARSMCTT